MTSFEKIVNDPKVKGVSDERVSGDGFWIYLKWGYCNSYDDPVAARCGDPLHAIHAKTPYEALKVLRHVNKCYCRDCRSNPNFPS